MALSVGPLTDPQGPSQFRKKESARLLKGRFKVRPVGATTRPVEERQWAVKATRKLIVIVLCLCGTPLG